MNVAIEAVNLEKRYRPDQPPANHGIHLRIRQGEVFGLLGANGAGKTTLVRMMTGLSRPTGGTLHLLGHDVIRQPEACAQLVALQPQGFALPYQATPWDLLEVTGRMRGLSRAEAHAQRSELLSEFALQAHAHKRIVELSGGLRRLTSIITTLIGQRPILIFDEPTNELDPEMRRVVWQRIRRCTRDGTTVILVTHNVVEAEQALDRVMIMRGGQTLATGTPEELKGRVDDRVRVEFVLKADQPEAIVDTLGQGCEIHRLAAKRYALTAPRAASQAIMSQLLQHLNSLDDFRVVTPNLEDVYLELTGGERLDK